MIARSRFIVRVVALLSLMLLIGSAVQGQVAPTRASGDYIVITGVNAASNCNSLLFDVVQSRTETLYVVGLAYYKGQFVSDSLQTLGPAYGATTFSVSYVNDRGNAPLDLFPLTPGKKIDIFFTYFSLDWEPLYEARARLDSCASTTVATSTHSQAFQLMLNHSFEQFGFDSGMVQNDFKAAFWNGKNVVNDARICTARGPRAGSSNYVGDCGFLFIADPGTTSKISQTYRGTIGEAGDIAYLMGFVQAFDGYTGGGSFQGVLKFADGTIHKLKVDFPTGPNLYSTHQYDDFYYLPAPIISAKVIIRQKNGSGTVAVDAVTLSVFTNSNPGLRALPLPAVAGAH